MGPTLAGRRQQSGGRCRAIRLSNRWFAHPPTSADRALSSGARPGIGERMRVLPSFVFLTVIVFQVACSGSPVGTGGEGTVTLDLSAYQPGHVPSALSLANQTLAFPLVVGPPSVRAISEDV